MNGKPVTSRASLRMPGRILAVLLILAVSTLLFGKLDPARVGEYELKAAFIYNFLKFTEWPKEIQDRPTIKIGIVGKDVYEVCAQALRDKMLEKKKMAFVLINKEILQEKADPVLLQELKACQILYMADSEKIDLKALKPLVKELSVLLIGEEKEYLEKGGMINFLIVDKKVRFEINLVETDKEKIKFRSQLLRLALRVIEK